MTAWRYALTLHGDEKHVFVPLPDFPGSLPPSSTALCGKLVRYLLRDQPWTEHVPGCQLCVTRGATLDPPVAA